MKNFSRILIIGILTSGFALCAEEEYPIRLLCEQGKNMIDIGVNVAKNIASYAYVKQESEERGILENSSYTTRAFISVTNIPEESGPAMQINATEARIFRVTHYRNFNVNVSEQSVKANFGKGIVEFPESSTSVLLTFDRANCSLTNN